MSEFKPYISTAGVLILAAGIVLAGAGPLRGQSPSPAGGLKPGPMTTSAKDETAGGIKGRILDYETQRPLGGVEVDIAGTGLKAKSDALGAYAFPGVAVGYYALTFRLEGYYEDTRTDVIVRSGRTTFLNVRLLEARPIQEEVRVTADAFPPAPDKPVSRTEFNPEELRRDAASAGDLSRALYAVPGVVKADEEANDLIVRGGSPSENGFYIDNIFIPNINHFPQQGASGGNVSMMNMDFVESLQFLTGGFDARYGDRLSSIIEIGYREGNRETLDGQFNLSIIGFGGQAEGPLPGRKGSWMFSANRSYLDLISGMLDSDNPSDFYDLQGKVSYDLDSANRLSLLAIGGLSRTEYGRDARERFTSGTAGLTWRHLWGGEGYSDTSLSYSEIRGRESEFWEWEGGLHEQYDYGTKWLTFRSVNHLRLSPVHRLAFGIDLQQIRFRNWDDYHNAETRLRNTSAAAFLNYTVHPFAGFSLSPGLRLEYRSLSGRLGLLPRLSFSWTPAKRLSVNGAFGIYTQQLPLFLLKQDPRNVRLRDPRARHLVLGVGYLLGRDIRLSLEAYDKRYDRFPMSPIYPYYFVIDDVNGDNDRFWDFGRLIDSGEAYARGLELTLQKKISRNLYGLASLSYIRTRYKDLLGNWHNRLFDNRFVLCLSGGYKPSARWEINVRWIWSGNKAFTPVDEAKSREVGYAWTTIERIMAGHMADYQNLSLRVDRRFSFKKSNLIVFAGALNILDHQNELYRYWFPPQGGYASEYMWGVIPYIGLEFEF